MKALFEAHISHILTEANAFLSELALPGLVVFAGSEQFYYDDNKGIPFNANHFFRYFCPAEGQGHAVIFRHGAEKPILLAYEPDDHWHFVERIEPTDYWPSCYEIKSFKSQEDIVAYVEKECPGFAFHGVSYGTGTPTGLAPASVEFVARLNWLRLHKSEYEVRLLEEATAVAARGHAAALAAFREGRSEYDIHMAFVQGVGCTENNLAYTPIVCLDENAATLHYFKKNPLKAAGKVFLIDAGAQVKGYASDISRTYASDKAHPVFRSVLSSLDRAQQILCSLVREGTSMIELGYRTHVEIAEILLSHGTIKDVGVEAAIDGGLTRDFFPHGLGHMLGLRVHDVGAHQISREGEIAGIDERFPYIRSRGTLRTGNYHTIEPGIYFNKILLEKRRASDLARHVDWQLVDELMPCGGIRIEDNVLVTPDGHVNMTRKYLP